jgi:hypothetical protein
MTQEPRADAHDMFVVHAMFRREFGLMPASAAHAEKLYGTATPPREAG